MNRLPILVVAAVAALGSAVAAAQSRAYDPKMLARYDVSYGGCEKMYPDMKGHRDEAYLSLYHATANEKTKARFAEARASAEYKAERAVAVSAAGKASAPPRQTIERECQALRSEWKRGHK
jgi:hypothetical protein